MLIANRFQRMLFIGPLLPYSIFPRQLLIADGFRRMLLMDPRYYT